MKSIGRCLERDWKDLLADCFPKIMVNILPYFALCGQDALVAQQQEKAHRVYDLLKDSSYLGKQVSVLDLSLSSLSQIFVCKWFVASRHCSSNLIVPVVLVDPVRPVG